MIVWQGLGILVVLIGGASFSVVQLVTDALFGKHYFALEAWPAGILLLSAPAVADAAEPLFPRGTGFYFSPIKFLVVVATYFTWISICNWVNRDAQSLSLAVSTWNGVMLAAGLVGLLIVWAVPTFFLSWLVLVVAVAAAAYSYVHVRNQK